MKYGTYKINVADENGEVTSDEASPVMHIIKDQEIDGVINVIGKTVVVYEKAGIETGDAGNRMCCGVIKYKEDKADLEPEE